MLEGTSRWGLLPVAVALAVLGVRRVGALTGTGPSDRYDLLRGFVGTLALAVIAVRVLGLAGQLRQDTLFAVLFFGTAFAMLVRRERALSLPTAELVTRETAPLVIVATGALVAVSVVAFFLPVWQWDSLGYHLPYVNFVLQAGSFADVPPDVPYIGTYPHVVEELYVAWRAMLPDDRLVDAAQIPLALLGVVAVASIAREHGASRPHAFACGLAWLTLPAVFLQLPTNYIDVATASLLLAALAFAFAPPTAANVVSAGVALGLFLGSKPNAPLATVLVGGLVAARAFRTGRRGSLAAGAACVLVLGADSYLRNLARHGNPIWPVRLTLGPIELPGTLPMQALLESGCAAPRLYGPLVTRVLRSWLSFDAPPVFDMRYGGLELLFLAALPVAAFVAWRRRSVAVAVAALATLASPDPAVPRYVLAFPGLVFALAAPALASLAPNPRRVALAGASLAAIFALVRAWPGLFGEGPPLRAYVGAEEHDRLRAVGADGSPAPFYDALEDLGRGDVALFDASVELPYLAWRPDLANHARFVADPSGAGDAQRSLADPHVRLLVVDEASTLAREALASGRFERRHTCKPRLPPVCRDARGEVIPPPRNDTGSSTCVILSRHR